MGKCGGLPKYFSLHFLLCDNFNKELLHKLRWNEEEFFNIPLFQLHKYEDFQILLLLLF